MNKQDEAALTFEPHRRRLTGLAYRMLGSLSEAEDIVQDAYLRWHAAERERVGNPRAYLSRTVARLCLDHLKSARARREPMSAPGCRSRSSTRRRSRPTPPANWRTTSPSRS
jgi:RNA polymerase sigma-70 factor (ECF subfamily)